MAKNEPDLSGNGKGIPKGSATADVRARFKLDTTEFNKISAGIKEMKASFQYLNQQLPNINTKLEKTLKLLQGISKINPGALGAGGGANPATGAIPDNPVPALTGSVVNDASANNAIQSVKGHTINIIGGGFGRGGDGDGGGLTPVKGLRTAQALTAVSAAIQALDSRISSNYDRSLSADKLAVSYQQRMGITQNQYYHQMRKPLQGERLGYGGINELLALQASTGIDAQKNAAGMAGLRAVSGYSLSTGDMASMAQTLGSAQVNNRMTMMLGTGLYGPGGQQRSMDQVIKDITQRTGLTNEKMLAGARQQGSATRARLLASGVPEDMVDLVLDYAESNVQYQKKGGKGMYDPSKKSQRKMMGIEDNFATQAEETARTKEGRDEDFYKRQSDNFAQMEKNTQAVTKALGKLEEVLSPLIGKRMDFKGGLVEKGIGGALMGIGAMSLSNPATAPLGMAMTMLGGSLFRGDPAVEPGSAGNQAASNGKSVPVGYGKGNRVPLSSLGNVPTFGKLNSTFKDRLLRMFAENPNVGIGEGFRSQETQSQLFNSRYREVTDGSKGDVTWNGKEYKLMTGAPAAPPGRSMHELGLAADLIGDVDWVVANAERFGLKTFKDVNGEKWHVQPNDIPNSRYEYEKQGSPWGTPAGVQKGSWDGIGPDFVGDKYVSAGGVEGSNYVNLQGMSLSEQVSAMGVNHTMYDTSTGSSSSPSVNGVSQTRVSSTPPPKGTRSMKAMDPRTIAQMMYKRGFKGQDLVNMLAIAGRESNWIPGVFNGKPPDKSYGLFQINMLDTPTNPMGTVRRKRYGISNDEELWDPLTNIKAARLEFGGGNYTPWNTEGGPMARTSEWMPKAQAAVAELGLNRGDPQFSSPTRGGTNLTVSGGTNVTIAPTIHVTSTGNNVQDARAMAHQIAQMLDKELRRELLRSK